MEPQCKLISSADFDIRKRTIHALNKALTSRKYDVIVLVTKRGSCLYSICKSEILPVPVVSDLFLYTNQARTYFRDKTVLLFDDSVRYGRHIVRLFRLLTEELKISKKRIDICAPVQCKEFKMSGIPIKSDGVLTKSDLDLFAKRSLRLFYRNRVAYLRYQPRSLCVSQPDADTIVRELMHHGFAAQHSDLFDNSQCRYFTLVVDELTLRKQWGSPLAGWVDAAYVDAFVFDTPGSVAYQLVPRVTLRAVYEQDIDVCLDALTVAMAPAFADIGAFKDFLNSENYDTKHCLLTYLLSVMLYVCAVAPSLRAPLDFSELAVHFGGTCQKHMDSVCQETLFGLDYHGITCAITPIVDEPVTAIPETISDLDSLLTENGIRDAIHAAGCSAKAKKTIVYQYDFLRTKAHFVGNQGDPSAYLRKYAKYIAEGSAVERSYDNKDPSGRVYYHTTFTAGELCFLLPQPLKKVMLIFDRVSYCIEHLSPLKRGRVYLAVARQLADIYGADEAAAFNQYLSFFTFNEKRKKEYRRNVLEFEDGRDSLLRSLREDEVVIVTEEERPHFNRQYKMLIDRLNTTGVLRHRGENPPKKFSNGNVKQVLT